MTQASGVSAWLSRLGISAAALLLSLGVHAQQSPQLPAAAEPTAPAAIAPAPITPGPAPAPGARYAAADLERAFSFMDGNHDGKVSRDEASGFRGVARNFDQADTNGDGFLSREEFDTAMNFVKAN